jgi:site-specific recombinase XerD
MARRFDDVLRRFESFLRVEKNLSPKTRAAYLYDLSRFREFLLENMGYPEPLSLESIGQEEVKAYIHHLREELDYRPATLSRTISSIRVFFDFTVAEGILEANPTDGIRNPRHAQKLPVYLVEGELKRLFGAPDLSTPLGVRDRAMLVMMAFCGLRLQELVGLNMLDLDFESGTVRVMGKGSKERLVPMNEDVARTVLEWLQQREPADGEKAVFLNRFGRRLSGRMVEKLVDKYVEQAGISKQRLSPHKLRHTFATMLHSRDVDLVDIQALLGHASISTTQIYTHTNTGRLRTAVERLDALRTGSD